MFALFGLLPSFCSCSLRIIQTHFLCHTLPLLNYLRYVSCYCYFALHCLVCLLWLRHWPQPYSPSSLWRTDLSSFLFQLRLRLVCQSVYPLAIIRSSTLLAFSVEVVVAIATCNVCRSTTCNRMHNSNAYISTYIYIELYKLLANVRVALRSLCCSWVNDVRSSLLTRGCCNISQATLPPLPLEQFLQFYC